MCHADTEKRVWPSSPRPCMPSEQSPDVIDKDAPQLTSGASHQKRDPAHSCPTELRAEDKNCSEDGRQASGFLCQSPQPGIQLNYIETATRQRENK